MVELCETSPLLSHFSPSVLWGKVGGHALGWIALDASVALLRSFHRYLEHTPSPPPTNKKVKNSTEHGRVNAKSRGPLISVSGSGSGSLFQDQDSLHKINQGQNWKEIKKFEKLSFECLEE